jgi:hypothetical protein
MSAFNATTEFTPTNMVVDPPNRPDQLAEAVLGSLSRGRWGYRGRPWGLLKTVILSFFSLGLLPLLIWPRRFKNFMKVEQQQLLMLADWLKLRTGRQEADELRQECAEKMGPDAFSGIVICFFVTLAILLFVRLVRNGWFDIPTLWGAAWGFDRPMGGYRKFLGTWSLFLTAGYFVHWLAVCRHGGALESFVAKFNAIISREGMPPVSVPSLGIGLEPLWMVAALIGLSLGHLWAIPLALGGVVQSRYVLTVSRQTRAEMARRVRSMLVSSRPELNVRNTPRPPSTQCMNDKCRAPVRLGAVFCPRCGSRSA